MDGDWHVIAQEANVGPFFPNLPVAGTITGRLRLQSLDGFSNLQNGNGKLAYAHGLSGIRQLSPESASLLDAVHEEAERAPNADLDQAPPGLFQ